MNFTIAKILVAALAALSLSAVPAMADFHYSPGYSCPPPGYGYGVTCFAQNVYGAQFYFTSNNPYDAQNGAMQICYNYSGGGYCQLTGCR